MNTFDKVVRLYDEPNEPQFVGYGNPNSEVLIIGQEVASEGEDYEKFVKYNAKQWQQTINEGLRAHELKEREGATLADYAFPEFFNPRNPFFPWDLNYQNSHTWYWYQRIMDAVCPHSGNTANFFDHCFVTEMSNISSKHNPGTKAVELSIAHRFDLMKETVDFWSHFKVVILACGPYANAIKDKAHFPTLERELFGEDGKLFYTNQLGRGISDAELTNIHNFLRQKLNLIV